MGTLVSGTPGTGALFTIFSFIITAVGILLMASAYGLWTIQPWGKNFSWWLYVISIPLNVIAIFPLLPSQHMSVGNTVLQLLGIVVDVIIIGYLGKPEISGLYELAGLANNPDESSRQEPR